MFDHLSASRGRIKNGTGALAAVRDYLNLKEPDTEKCPDLQEQRKITNKQLVELAKARNNFIFRDYDSSPQVRVIKLARVSTNYPPHRFQEVVLSALL